MFQSGTTHVVWVTGPGPLLRLQKLQLSHFPSGMARAQLLRPEVRAPPAPAGTSRLEVRSSRVAVPDTETTVRRLPAALARKHHIIQVGGGTSGHRVTCVRSCLCNNPYLCNTCPSVLAVSVRLCNTCLSV